MKRKGTYQEERGCKQGRPQKLLAKIKKMVSADPENLLPGNEHLLNEDFDTLGRAITLDQLLWVAEIEASMAATNNRKTGDKGGKQAGNVTIDSDSTPVTRPVPRAKEQGSESSNTKKKRKWK